MCPVIPEKAFKFKYGKYLIKRSFSSYLLYLPMSIKFDIFLDKSLVTDHFEQHPDKSKISAQIMKLKVNALLYKSCNKKQVSEVRENEKGRLKLYD